MKWSVIACLLLVSRVHSAEAAHFKFSGSWGRGEFSLNFGHPGGLFDGGILGGGLFDGGILGGGLLGGFADELRQSRFEHRFEDIMTAYDDGLANVTDFYSSDDYADIVIDTERLLNRYDSFVTGVDRSIDRLGETIDFANDRLTFFDDLLAKYQERDDLSEARLERIEDLIAGAQDLISLKIDLLTDRQSTLQENFAGYQEFQTTLTGYRDEIVAAGGGVTDSATLSATVEPASGLRALSTSEAAVDCDAPAISSGSAAIVPEPAAATLALVALAGASLSRRVVALRI